MRLSRVFLFKKYTIYLICHCGITCYNKLIHILPVGLYHKSGSYIQYFLT